MDAHELEGRLAAIEVLLHAAMMQMDAITFSVDYHQQKECAIVGLTNNPEVSDKMLDSLERQLEKYERQFRILPEQGRSDG